MPSTPSQPARPLVRVGLITGPGGHSFNIWAEKMNPPPGAIRTTGMQLTHAFTLNPNMPQAFADKYPDVTVVQDPRDMIGHIDGVFIDDITAISHYPLLARPFLEAGVPTFVNRPFATSMAKGREMVDLAAQHNTPMFSASTWEFDNSVGDLRAKIARLNNILGYVAHNSMSDYYSHGLHGVWYIHAALRDEIAKGRARMSAAAYHTPNWRTSRGLVVYEHESPSGPYYGNLQLVSGADGNAYMRVFGDSGWDPESKIPGGGNEFMYTTWNALPLVIQRMFETGEAPQTGEHLMEKLAMFLLPFYSVLEADGAMVPRQVLDNWELPRPGEALMEDGHPTDSAFNEPYSDAQLEALEKLLG